VAGRSPLAATTVGVIDSGVGGLTVVAAMQREMPALPVRYLADTARFPYGDRPSAEVAARALELGERLLAQGCSLLVIACNTASSAALELLRERLVAPVVGMEPPLKPAVERTRSGRVAVLVTAATADGDRLARLHEHHAAGSEVLTVPLPGLADLVEAGELAGPRVEAIIGPALAALRASKVDQVALGCTHYAFLRPALAGLLGPDVEIIDAAEPVARRVRQQLEAHGLAVPEGERVAPHCAATGDRAAFAASLERLRAAGADLPALQLAREAAA
jgi:glutamate racemase